MGLTVKYKLKETWSFKITPYLYTRKWYQGNRPPVDRNKFHLGFLLHTPPPQLLILSQSYSIILRALSWGPWWRSKRFWAALRKQEGLGKRKWEHSQVTLEFAMGQLSCRTFQVSPAEPLTPARKGKELRARPGDL